MKINKLKKISRKDLLELLVLQSKRIDELENELNKVLNELNNKNILIKECGSLAEASLRLNKVFEMADLAARQYLDNVKRISTIKEESLYEK